MLRTPLLACVLAVLGLVGTGGCGSGGDEAPRGAPQPGDSFQWQLSGYPPDLTVDAEVYDLDLVETPDEALRELQGRSVTAVCYFSAGTAEEFREDATFPDEVVGEALDDFPDERWLDVRRIDLLAPVIEARLDRCAARGFTAVELDNVDAYANDSGFALTREDQLAFDRWLAEQARARGLSPGLKGTAELAGELEPHFDWALVEQCLEYEECEAFQPFVDAGKAVFVVEYGGGRDEVCAAAETLDGMTVVLADMALDGAVQPC